MGTSFPSGSPHTAEAAAKVRFRKSNVKDVGSNVVHRQNERPPVQGLAVDFGATPS